MGVRTALAQSKIVTFGALLAVAWTLLTAVHVVSVMEGLWASQDVAVGAGVGQTAASGVVGALVMAALVGLLVYLVADLGEAEPAPTPWPPESE